MSRSRKYLAYLFRFSLRRKVLLIVLALGLIPSFLTLLFSTTLATTALRQAFIQKASDEARTKAERLGDRIQGEIIQLQALANGESVEWSGAEPWVFDLTDGPPANIPEEITSVFQRTIEANLDHGIFAFEVGEAPDQKFWGAARSEIHPHNRWAMGEIHLGPLLESVPFLGDTQTPDWLVLSSRSGAIGIPEGVETAAALLQVEPMMMRKSTGIIDQGPLHDSPWSYVRVGGIMSLTEPTGDPVVLVVLRRVDLSGGMNALAYGFWIMILFGVVFGLAFGLLGIWMSGRLVGPIKKLRAGFIRLREGDLDFRIDVHTGDEIQDLGTAMNEMAATLQATYTSLGERLLEIDEKARQIAITHDLAQSVNRSLDLDKMMHAAVTEISQLVPVECLALGLVDEKVENIRIENCWPETGSPIPDGTILPISGSHAGKCLGHGEVTVVQLDGSGVTEDTLLSATTIRELCIVPLTTTNGPVGVLLLGEPGNHGFKAQHLRILEQLAASLATAIDHSRLYRKQATFAQWLEEEVAARTRDLERAQAQLVRAEKLAAFGDLAANVAHEINNPLSIIKNYLALLEQQCAVMEPGSGKKESDILGGISVIREEIDRIVRIIDGLRGMRGDSMPRPVSLDVNNEIESLMQLFNQTFKKKNIHIETDLDKAIPPCLLSRDYLRQVLINLLRNATDAIQESGTIRIITREGEPGPDFFSIHIVDDGPGIPKSCLDKIFDPFFTTKKDGGGTGLGLSISYRLATTLGGRIEAQSSPGNGARMTVVLPHSQPPEMEVPANSETESGVRHVRREGDRIIIG